jgi:hypothetical protein
LAPPVDDAMPNLSLVNIGIRDSLTVERVVQNLSPL